jgi:hypothetical protein
VKPPAPFVSSLVPKLEEKSLESQGEKKNRKSITTGKASITTDRSVSGKTSLNIKK